MERSASSFWSILGVWEQAMVVGLWPWFGAEAIGYMATNIDFRHKSNNLSFVEKSNYYYNFFY